MATLLSFVRPHSPHGWSNDEKAQFARIQKLLGDAGVMAEIEHGLTDEGEPWCVLCSGTTGDVIIHVARIDGHYLFDSAALPCTIKGRSLDDCAKRFIDDATVLAPRAQHGSKILLHPSAMLAGVMLTIFLYLEAIGENPAYSKELIELDPEQDILDMSGEEAEAKAETGAKSAPEEIEDDEDSPIFVLKQMLQQIADAQKVESDRTGAQNGAAASQGWSALLPTAVVAAAIAYAQDNVFGFGADDETLVSAEKIETEADQGPPLPEVVEDAEPGTDDFRATTVIDAQDDAPATDTEVVEAKIADFLLAEMPDVVFKNTHDYIEPEAAEIVSAEEAAIAQDSFVFEDETVQAADTETTGSPIQLASFAGDDVSSISRLVRLLSDSSVEIQNEVFSLGDFIEIYDTAALDTSGSAEGDIGNTETPLVAADTLAFKPYEPGFEVASSQQIAEQIRSFVKITGMLRFDMSDRDNQIVYDRSVIGREDDENVVSRSFSMQDDSTFTFVGLSHELDLLFA